MTVFKVLNEARKDWYFIGINLGCKESDLDEIDKNYSTDKHRCFEMLQSRIQQGGLTRSMLSNSLKEEFVQRDDVARKIEALALPLPHLTHN